MDQVAVLGLGAMGYALADKLTRSGRKVTVWNRTAEKGAPLSELGASVASDPAAAISVSDLVIVCVDSYPVASQVMSQPGCSEALSGRTVLQLSTGSPDEAREAKALMTGMNARYLDGAIMAYPDQIGSPDATILVSGELSVFGLVESTLKELAGGAMHVGESIGSASALDCAGLSTAIGAYLGALHGASICEAEGVPVGFYGELIQGLIPVLGEGLREINERVSTEQFEESHASLATYSRASQRILAHAEASGANAAFPSYASGLLGKAESAGLGAKDLASLITILRSGG
ncbi:MAG: NAD(P)-dependent oxidoreductase [Pseudomonadales bacterium]